MGYMVLSNSSKKRSKIKNNFNSRNRSRLIRRKYNLRKQLIGGGEPDPTLFEQRTGKYLKDFIAIPREGKDDTKAFSFDLGKYHGKSHLFKNRKVIKIYDETTTVIYDAERDPKGLNIQTFISNIDDQKQYLIQYDTALNGINFIVRDNNAGVNLHGDLKT